VVLTSWDRGMSDPFLFFTPSGVGGISDFHHSLPRV